MPCWPQAPNTEEKIQLAIKAYNLGYYKSKEGCAKAHDIDPNIFRCRLSGKQRSHQVAHTNQYRISPAGEDAIVRHCIYLAQAGFPCRYRTVRTIATLILQRESTILPHYISVEPLGKTWIYQFLKRQEELRTCYVRSLAAEQALAGNNPARVQQFFEDYTTAKTQYNVAELDIWNMDETGYAMGFAYSAKVVVLRGSLVNFKTIDGLREWVSQIDAIGMHGQIIPPFIIFRGRQHTASLWQEAVEAVGDCIIGMSENSWSN